jgi:hypothetical protein
MERAASQYSRKNRGFNRQMKIEGISHDLLTLLCVFYDFREVNKKMFFELGRRENMFYVEVVNFGRKSGRVALTVFFDWGVVEM